MINFFKSLSSRNKVISIILFSLIIILFILVISTRKSVQIDQAYYEKEDVALYLIKYHELPINYYCKSPSDNRDYSQYGFDMYGGFIHLYDENILPSELANASLKECDIYTDGYSVKGQRGIKRLVYTSNTNNVRVFYTEDHYESYTELTEFQINIVSYSFEIVLAFTIIGTVIYMVILYKKSKETNKRQLLE